MTKCWASTFVYSLYLASICCLVQPLEGLSSARLASRHHRLHRGPRSNIQRRLAAASSADEYFITVGNGTSFYNGCNTFYVAGWNEWEVIEAGAGAPVLFGATLPPRVTGPQMLRNLMDKAVANGLNVMRAFATAMDPWYTLETSPGVYNEDIFRGLDYALDQARQRGIKVILSLLNNWSNPGGIDQIVGWSGTAKVRTDFFSDENCRDLYRQHVNTVLRRVNSINGRTYLEDPTIMAWNLINEPRCLNCPDALQSWLETMVAYVKSIDSNHLLSIGAEGFYGINDVARSNFANPQGPNTWANKEGQDFIANNMIEGIDFATIHSWADNWQDPTTSFQENWIQQHDTDGRLTLNKPVLLEEFGKWVKNSTSATQAERQRYFQLAYSMVQQSASSGGSLQGVAFWEWFEQGQIAAGAEGYGEGLYGITTDDPVWSTISSSAKALTALSAPVPGCNAQPAKTPAVNLCQHTWLDGKPGTGYEGPQCNIDVNECVRGTANCAENAACTNKDGGYLCTCYWGYIGNGSGNCTAGPGIARLALGYRTDGPGRLACSEGKDVPYPVVAPGFIEDPTGWSKRQGGFGSLIAVSVQGCEIACEAAAGCDSFSHNSVQQQCFLKNGGSMTTCLNKDSNCTSANQDLVPQAFSCGSWQTYYRLAGPVVSITGSTSLTSAG